MISAKCLERDEQDEAACHAVPRYEVLGCLNLVQGARAIRHDRAAGELKPCSALQEAASHVMSRIPVHVDLFRQVLSQGRSY